MMLPRNYLLVIITVSTIQHAFSQTCCSAGAPITSSLDIPSNQNQAISFGIEYEHNSVNWLVENDNRLENDPRTRQGSSIIARINISLDNRWAFGAYIPFVTQQRASFSSEQKASGIGDLTLLAQYTQTMQKGSLKWGLGIKMPTGNHFISDEIGVILSPDMQSGSGTFDFIGRLAISNDHFLVNNLYNQTDLSFRYNTTNDHFGDRSRLSGRRFRFGNEVLVSTIFSYLIVFDHWFLIPDLGFQFRHARPNEEQGLDAPNSGGNWFRLLLGTRWTANERLIIRPYTEIPLWQQLQGTQITTNLKLGIQFRYSVYLDDSQDIIEPVIF